MATVYEYNLGYRFQGLLVGHEFIEGFTGVALSNEKMAYKKAVEKVKRKCEAISETFDEKRLIIDLKSLSIEEFQQLQEHWKVSRRSDIC